MSQLTYEASVYTNTVKYKNFKGKVSETPLHFALDPLQLMSVIADFRPAKTKSKNPAKQGEVAMTDAEQIKMVRNLAQRAAGFPSDDGESWEPFDGFEDSIAGKAFLTKLVSSDQARKEFSEKVILQPFRDYVGFSKADPSNTAAETLELEQMLAQLENVFSDKPDETVEARRERLRAEMAALDTVPGEVVDS